MDEAGEHEDRDGSASGGGDVDGGNGGEEPGVVETLRSHSAGWLLLAERMHPQQHPALDELDELGTGSETLRAALDEFRQQALLVHNAMSAQARAYEEMLEAGGPDDPEAYENYRQATEFLNDLLP
ncbi:MULTISPECIES: hypothetical protein [unclassified Actinopolyspora]|uniref:hypothetical protein n=1 Tax=unclassified Actinopolyspora TaxID=2639451 RepID=UPI0013F63CD5|nr:MULTISPECIES: hypothetical protein [unclassified Actinopolyspora]NHD17611.1 hypothetical protein [Actinopolyspora sp. BKK2]NHE76656.1 hypothetical protein [Actinopolyspora sp. BKK1]